MATDAKKPIKLPRTAKGKKPVYFDPVTDKLLSMIMTLMGELSVVRDRLDHARLPHGAGSHRRCDACGTRSVCGAAVLH